MDSILVVIVIYNMKLSESKAYNSLGKCKNAKFFVYDNSPTIHPGKYNDNVLLYVNDTNNGGLSKAYNYAAKYADKNGFKWLLLADQDTYFPENILSIYYSAIEENREMMLFVPKVRINKQKYLSPVKNNHYISYLSNNCPTGKIDSSKYGVINSGMLINIRAFWNVGGYNEKVWLDFSDYQFLKRFSSMYKEIFVVDIECMQSFSNEDHNFDEKLKRYKCFCSSLKNYKPLRSFNKFWIGLMVFKRALSLSLSIKSFSPLLIYINKYLL